MKQFLLFLGPVWLAFVVEEARPDVFPPGVLVLPVVVAGMLWSASALGVLTGGVTLILSEIVHPQPLPLVPVLLTFVVAAMLSRRRPDLSFGHRSSLGRFVPEWLQIVLLTVFGALLFTCPAVVLGHVAFAEQWELLCRYLMIAVPACLLLACLMQLADEFGMRRTVPI